MPARACLLLLVSACAYAHMLGKEYVCQDPDTGTIHGINTTWRSTTFCGNYSCKIRTINTAQPTPKIMVNLFDPHGRTSQSINKNNDTNEFSLTKILPELSIDNDRLLNKAEINKITELLHTVKKSDLQAVIELYNVAQEIYKDMKVTDAKTHNSEIEANIRVSEDPTENFVNKISYWYDPHSGPRKVADMKTQGSEYKDTYVYPYRRPYYVQPYFYSQSNTNYPTYFSGSVLSNGDFGRLGYNNPRENQRSLPSYYQQRNAYDISGTNSQSSCNPCPVGYQYQTPMPANYPQRANNIFPYPPPFYNFTHGYNNYHKGNPWAYYDYYKNYPYQSTPQIQRNSGSPNAEVQTEKNIAGDEHQANTEKDNSWKTDPLSDEIINEIRANIAQRGKLLNIPLKKRIKLERAAKVIKLDQFTRKTRSTTREAGSEETNAENNGVSQEGNKEERNRIENKEVLEVYIERVTCEPTAELGYFKIGNMTKPFPDCCPQKIENKL